jgi:hypothetical protein
MGFNIQSSDTQQTLNDFTSVINTAVINAKNQANLNCTAANQITVLSGSIYNPNGPAIPCPLNIQGVNITQTADASCNLSGEFNNNFQVNLTTNVQNNVEQWIKDNLQSNQGWLAIAFSAQSAVNQTAATVATRIANGLVANITNTCSAQLEGSNTGIVSICGNYTKDFNFQQSAFVTNITSCIANNTVSFIANDTILNNMSQFADNTLSSSQEGLSTIAKWLILAGVILGVLIILGIVFFLIFGSKGGSATSSTEQQKEALRTRIASREQGRHLRSLEEGAEARSLSPRAEEGLRSAARRFGI